MRLGVAALLVATLLVAAGCGGSGGGTSQSPYRGTEVSPQKQAPELALRDHEGRLVRLSDLRGRWVAINFLYTACPDVCPAIAGHLNAVLRTPEGKQAKLRALTISVDPERDTPEAVRLYVLGRRLGPDYSYLIGTREELEPVWADYAVGVFPGPGDSITHSTFTLLIDPEGTERIRYDSTVQTADFVHDLALLTGEDEP